MVAIVGNDGSIIMPSGGGLLNRWTVQFTRVVAEVTGFADAVSRRNRAGVIDISGTASGVPDTAVDPGVIALPTFSGASMTLQAQLGNTWIFIGLISSVSFDVSKLGESLVTFDFVSGIGDSLAEAWA